MKKAVSMLIITAILLTCCVVSASAQGKIADSLQAKMDTASDSETIRVIIWLNNPVDKSEVFRQAFRECGYIGGLPLNMTAQEVDAYRTVYNRIVHEQEAAAVNSFIESFGLDEACINETYCLCINANLTKAQIASAASYTEVEGVYFDDEGVPVEPLTAELPNLQKRFETLCTSMYEEAEVLAFEELYTHLDAGGEADWILVYGCSNVQAPMPLTTVIGNRVISVGSVEIPFDTGYAIYDLRSDGFMDAAAQEAAGYDDFTAVFDSIVTEGRLIGDIDGDNDLSIVDATLIQRCEAQMCDYPANDIYYLSEDYYATEHYLSDFDRDGERGILDATCLQRWLIDAPF